jgi:hypothetical protein
VGQSVCAKRCNVVCDNVRATLDRQDRQVRSPARSRVAAARVHDETHPVALSSSQPERSTPCHRARALRVLLLSSWRRPRMGTARGAQSAATSSHLTRWLRFLVGAPRCVYAPMRALLSNRIARHICSRAVRGGCVQLGRAKLASHC